MMPVVWYRAAVLDLVLVRGFISQDNPAAARHVVKTIQDAIRRLQKQPSIGRPGRVPGTRELVIDRTPYILPYRVRDQRIEVLRVLHASRRWPDSLKGLTTP